MMKKLKVIFIIITLIVLTLNGLYLNFKRTKYQEIASNEAISLAQSLKSLIQTDDIQNFTGSEDDLNLLQYNNMKASLIRLVNTTSKLRFAYIMAEQNENIVIIMDSELPDSVDYSPPGQIYYEANDWTWKPLIDNETVITPPKSDRWGTWISILVPINDSQSGEPIALFGIDYSSKEWHDEIWRQLVTDITVVIFVLLLYFSLLYITFQQFKLNNLNKKLAFDEALYHSVFNQAPVGIAIVNDKSFIYKTDFGHTSMNTMFEKILGRSNEELSNIEWPTITHPDDLQMDLELFDQFKKGVIGGYTIKKRFIKPDGSFVWTSMIISPILGLYGNTSLHMCLLEDITNQKAAEAALIESEKKYRNITENMSDVVWQSDLNLSITYISPSVQKLLGDTPEEHLKRKSEEKFSEETLKKFHIILSEELDNEKNPAIDKKRTRIIEVEHFKADGSTIWVEMIISFLRDQDGNTIGFQGTSRDISQRKKAEMALKENERRESVLLSHLPGLAYRCKYDRQGTMLIVSDGCYSLTGYLPDNFINNKDLAFNDIILPKYIQPLLNKWEHAVTNKQNYIFEYEIKTASGDIKWVLEIGQGVYNDEGNIVALEGIILDISDKKDMEIHLIYVSEHDKLTNLYNRDYLESLLEKELQKHDKITKSIISINLSTVQLLTGNYGFHYTQNLIKKASETLCQYCTDNHLLFKTYDNRFVFYITNYKDTTELLDFCKIISKSLDSLFITDRINGGIGILEIEHDNNKIDVDLLLRRVLIASEKALSLSDKQFAICFYNDDLEAAINREGDIKKSLTDIAYSTSEDEFYLQYQPILDLKTNTISGFEALARLNTKKLGMISPVEFIPIAEKTKLIIPIGEKVIIDSFNFLNKLKNNGYTELKISINVSVIQLLNPDFINRLIDLILKMKINPKNIGLEITESVFMSDYENINKIIEKIRQYEIFIAIDDFGTGYSSLAREKELNVDYLKIDKFFVDKLLDTDINKAIISDIISMSHKLGHFTVAEGVEYECQLEYLKNNGCDNIQGYLFSKPLNEEDALKFISGR